MNKKRIFALLLSLLISLSLSGCDIPMPGFAEYDVSAYIQALLDSSYHDSHEGYMEVATATEEAAMENNTATIENAAINFCNAYQLVPNEAQLEELKVIMHQAFALAKYTVKDEKKVDTGYYLEVEVVPITNFAGCEAEFETLKNEAQQEATEAHERAEQAEADAVERYDEYGAPDENGEYDVYGNYVGPAQNAGETDGENSGGEENSSDSGDELSSPEGADGPTALPDDMPDAQTTDVNAIYVDKVIEYCKRALANITYDAESRIVPFDIIQTEEGELQIDLNQLDTLDQTVIRFE